MAAARAPAPAVPRRRGGASAPTALTRIFPTTYRAVADLAGNQVELFTGADNGTFTGPTTISVPGAPIDIGTGDFNGDRSRSRRGPPRRRPDHDPERRLGSNLHRSGGFDPGSSGNEWVGVADFDNDSDPDLVVANDTSNDVKVFKGGLGSTFSQVECVRRRRRRCGTIGDFNDDGDEDLAIPSRTGRRHPHPPGRHRRHVRREPPPAKQRRRSERPVERKLRYGDRHSNRPGGRQPRAELRQRRVVRQPSARARDRRDDPALAAATTTRRRCTAT